MNLDNNISSPSICKGCLSVDRKLTTINDDEKKKIFAVILQPLEASNQPLLLCWECLATVNKILRFKTQVHMSHEYLARFMLQETSLNSLSHIKTTRIHTNSTILELWENKTDSESIVTVHTSKDGDHPLAFIKIEENDFGDDIEGFYVDDLVKGDDDKDLKAVLKTDPSQYEEVKSKTKAEEEDFNDSDDEPLTCKKKREDSVYKPRGKRKKKEDSVKVDRRKQPGPKREKPAGVVKNTRVERKLEQLNVASDQLEMVVLSWEEVELERQRALESVTFTRHEYRCIDCAIGFNHRFKLENHMKKHDPSSGALVCGVCRIRCRDTHALGAHKRRHRVRWRCCTCGSLWSRAAVAADHLARTHGAAPTHTCTVCGHQETTLGKLRNHIKNHAERQKCELCGKSFRDRTSLRTHLFIHKGEKEYSCPQCDKKFLFKKAMQVHMVTHDAPAHLYCHQCDMNFKNQMSYYQHMKYNLKHIDPAKLKFACQVCDKKFVKATRLEEHNIAVHLKATPITCSFPDCTFACSSRPVLRTHTRMVHRERRRVRNHVCHVCGKAYTTKKTLEGHMRSHTGERPFKCQHCPSTFGYEAALYNHNKLVHLKLKSRRTEAPAPPTTTEAPTWQINLPQTNDITSCT